jgi:hypothetical protein
MLKFPKTLLLPTFASLLVAVQALKGDSICGHYLCVNATVYGDTITCKLSCVSFYTCAV